MSKKIKGITIISLLFLIFIILSYKLKSFIFLFLSLIFISSFLFFFKRINKNFLLIYFSVLISLFLIEVSFKINFKEIFNQKKITKNNKGIVHYNNFQYEKTYLGSQLKEGVYQHYKKKNSTFIFNNHYEVNSDNFRINKFIKNSDNKKLKASFFGDSNIFGWGLNDTETLPHIFYEQNKNYNVFNYGIIGGSPNLTLEMLKKNNHYLGDLNIIFSSSYQLPRIACNRDYTFNTPSFKLINEQLVFNGYCILSFFKLNFQLPRIIGSIINRSNIIKILNNAFTNEFNNGNIKLYLEILKEINNISLKNNKDLILIYYASKDKADIDREIEDYLIKNKIPFISVSFNEDKYFIKHDFHFSKLANEKFLESINDYKKN